ncbi:MAG: homoprotocatechuate degradation operon regulator HpaR [Rhizobiaceae bacterium]|nr:homoprotocatechuate degradation operon regulator HpaR [Rhizobiaceae bacterium]
MTKQPDSAIRETSRALPIALLRARETIMAPIREMLSEIGLTEQKWRILRTLDEFGKLEQTAISDRACLLLPSVTRITKSLESQGLLTRFSDHEDKRKMMVEITDQGRKIVRENITLANEIYDHIETRLGKEKVDDLLDLLAELKDLKI